MRLLTMVVYIAVNLVQGEEKDRTPRNKLTAAAFLADLISSDENVHILGDVEQVKRRKIGSPHIQSREEQEPIVWERGIYIPQKKKNTKPIDQTHNVYVVTATYIPRGWRNKPPKQTHL